MQIIRYSRCDRSNRPTNAEKKTVYSDSPFIKDECLYSTDMLRIKLPNGFFFCCHEKSFPNYVTPSPANGMYFHWCVSGSGTFNDITFQENDIFVSQRGMPKKMISDGDNPWELYWCAWKGTLSDIMESRFNSYNCHTVYSLKGSPDLSGLFDFLIYNPHCEHRSNEIVDTFVELLLMSCQTQRENSSSRLNDSRLIKVNQIKKYIDDNYANTSVEEISSRFHYNRKYITRIFHEYVGTTMCDYIASRKIQAAENYLLTSDMLIEEIAVKSGYSTYTSFARAFKKKNGITPSEFTKIYNEN